MLCSAVSEVKGALRRYAMASGHPYLGHRRAKEAGCQIDASPGPGTNALKAKKSNSCGADVPADTFGTQQAGLYGKQPKTTRGLKARSKRKRPLWTSTDIAGLLFQGGAAGSNPVGDISKCRPLGQTHRTPTFASRTSPARRRYESSLLVKRASLDLIVLREDDGRRRSTTCGDLGKSPAGWWAFE